MSIKILVGFGSWSSAYKSASSGRNPFLTNQSSTTTHQRQLVAQQTILEKTTLNTMTSASQSTTSLLSAHASRSNPQRHQPKDYAAALATLQSTYGAGASAPTPVHQREQYGRYDGDSQSSTSSNRSSSRKGAFKRLFGSQSTSSAPDGSAIAPQTHAPSQHGSQKNYEAAFGDLQSSYGLSASSNVLGECDMTALYLKAG
jgi:hypothetical protein